MAFNITYIIQAIDKFSETAKRVARSTDQIIQKFDKLSESGKKLQRFSRGVFLKLALPVSVLGIGVLRTAATFQTLQMQFDTLLGSAKKGHALFQKMKDASQKFGAATTIEFAGAASQLLAVGAQAKQIPQVLQRLANVAAGTALTLGDVTRGYAASFAEHRVRRLYIRGLLQTTNILGGMAKSLGKSTEQTMKLLRAGKLHFRTLRDGMIIINSTDKELGRFRNMQKHAMHTLSGAYRLVKDSVQILSATVGAYAGEQLGLVKGAIKLRDIIMKIDKNFDVYTKKYAPLIKKVGITIAAFLGLMVTTFVLGTIIRSVGVIVKIFSATIWFLRNSLIVLQITIAAVRVVMGLLRGTIILTEIAMAPVAVIILLIAVAVGLLVWGIKKLVGWLWGKLTPAFKALWRITKLGFQALVDGARKHFPLLTKIITDSAKWIIKSFDWVLSKIKTVIHFFSSLRHLVKSIKPVRLIEGKLPLLDIHKKIKPLAHTLKKTIETTGVMTNKMLGPLTVSPVATVPLSAPMGGLDLVGILSTAFPSLSEGLQANINVGITSKSDLKIDHVTHSSSSPNVEVGTTMPLTAQGVA